MKIINFAQKIKFGFSLAVNVMGLGLNEYPMNAFSKIIVYFEKSY